jgi:hypothetical protein
MRPYSPLLLALLGASCTADHVVTSSNDYSHGQPAIVKKTEDFDVSGDGSNPAWARAEWNPLHRRQEDGHPYEARFKLLYSATGIYVLMDGTDTKLTTTGRKDFGHLWEEDVYEAFFWTDGAAPVYFEYEISPMNAELPILVPNNKGTFMGWLPWHYDGGRKVRKATAVRGGPKELGATVSGWSAEFFIPYSLFTGFRNVPPQRETRWRANFYRVDYDNGKMTQWHWAPVGPSFHEYWNFGVLAFE